MSGTPPLLTSVFRCLSVDLQAIPHIPQCVNAFLMPETIDAAVYNDLQAGTRVWLLYSSQVEGYSAEAFVGAAANGHLDVFIWLYENYRGLGHPIDEMVAAAGHGRLQVEKSIVIWLPFLDCDLALRAAAAGGHLAVVDGWTYKLWTHH
ncbi:hypothetical protein PI124_g8427 [Phytophthora idaei]|nr:hypothetical protein PI125_g8299 [Phytophthora idaei]KAG3246854.1 hypothetical protein PI124_g8427 [Phytophthora idaei]